MGNTIFKKLFTTSSKSIDYYVNPEDYGARGDGVTDDTTAFQAAINSGFPIMLKEKTYFVNGTLTTLNNTTIIGLGKGSVLYKTANSTMILIQGNYNLFQNFTIRGNSTGSAQNGIYADGNASFNLYRLSNIIDNVYFEFLGNSGIAVRNIIGSNSGVNHEGAIISSNCVFKSCTIGIYLLVRAEYNCFTNFSIDGCTTGIRNVGGNNNFIGGQVTNCTTGVSIESGANDAHCSMVGTKINHNTTNVSCTQSLAWTFNSCQIFAGNMTLTSTGKNIFNACEFSMNTNTLTITNSPAIFTNCEFTVVPTTYTLTGTAPIVINCYSLTNKCATPKVVYNELTTLTTNTTYSVPAGMSIESIIFENTTANAVTGGIKIGTTSGGTEVILAKAVGSNEITQVTSSELLRSVFSSTVATTLHIQAVTSWNSASVRMYLKLKPLI